MNQTDMGLKNEAAELRREAEKKVEERLNHVPAKLDSLSSQGVQQLIHELRVYHVELEMQNEELRKTRQELEESRARYFDLYNLAPVGYVTLDDSGRIHQVNLTGAEMLGMEKENLIKQKLNRFVAEESQDSYYLNCKQLFETGEEQIFEVRLARKDSSRFWSEIKMNIMQDKESGQLLSRAVIIDITERKQYQEAFKSSLELEQRADKIESIGILAGGIAHDFNNYLAVLLGNISLAKFYHDDPGKIQEKLTNIEKATLQAKELTNQLSVFAKGGAPVKKIAPLNNLIMDSANFALSGSNVRCELSLPQDSLFADIDEGQIYQVLNNIIINANQAMPEGGTIWISLITVTLGEGERSRFPLPRGTYLKLSIKDEGPGIPEEFLGKIFDPFFTTKSTGSGLGLATSYTIIKSHGGFLEVESQEGVGSTFHILLPSFAAAETAAGNNDDIVYGSGTILVIDDRQDVREIMADMLSSLGYEVWFAADGEEAIKVYKNTKQSGQAFDLVVMDLTIPGGIGGKDTIKEILKIDPGVKAVVSSGYFEDPVMASYQEYGFKGVIRKPFSIEELSKVIHQANHS